MAPGAFDIGEIALVATLGYLRLRMPKDDWFAGRPRLKAWYESLQARPSVAGTAPN